MLCNFAHQFPPFVASFLERGRWLRRRFREETVTDLLMGNLMTVGDSRIIVEFPDEPVTGADMEWNFVNPDENTFFRILLQAKQAYGGGGFWSRHCYRELLHGTISGSTLQAVALCDTARAEAATYPLYIFYHPQSTCTLARAAGFPGVLGVTLADGYCIERLVCAATTRTLRTRNKSVGQITPLLFPLSDLFCPSTILPIGPFGFAPHALKFPVYIEWIRSRRTIGLSITPTPSQIRQRIVDMRSLLAQTHSEPEGESPVVPAVSDSIPREIRSAIYDEEFGSVAEGGSRRWRVTFVSATPRDLDAELERLRPESS